MRRRPLAILALLATISTVLAGCELLGYPSKADIAANKEAVLDAETRADDAEAALDKLAATVEKAERAQVKAANRSEAVRTAFVNTADQLDNVEGEAANALADTLQGLLIQLKEATSQEDRTAEAIASAQAAEARIGAELVDARSDIEALDAELEAMVEQSQNATAGLMQGVKELGGAVQAMGVPGAGLVSEQAAGLIAIFGNAGFGTLALQRHLAARKRRRERDAATHERGLLADVVRVNERVGLIQDENGGQMTAAEVEEAKAAARDLLGPEAHALLRLIKSVPAWAAPDPGTVKAPIRPGASA